jgi:hypothetical protein
MPDRPLPPPLPLTEDHHERLTQARAVAEYEIGAPGWADVIVAAYLNPAASADRLTREIGPTS